MVNPWLGFEADRNWTVECVGFIHTLTSILTSIVRRGLVTSNFYSDVILIESTIYSP